MGDREALSPPLKLSLRLSAGGASLALPRDWRRQARAAWRTAPDADADADDDEDADPWACEESPWVSTAAVWAPASGVQTYVALGCVGGATWLLTYSAELSSPLASSKADANGLRAGSSHLATGSQERPRSPSPSIASTSSRRHVSTASLSGGVPFAGFAASGAHTPISPPSSATLTAEDSMQVRAQGESVPAESSRDGRSGAERRLEAQWHAGQRVGLMGSLGLGPHHSHPHTAHASPGDSPPRSRRPSATPPFARRRSSKSFAVASDGPQAEAATAAPAAREESADAQLSPRMWLRSLCASPVAALKPTQHGLLVLQASGLLTLWSDDGAVHSSLSLLSRTASDDAGPPAVPPSTHKHARTPLGRSRASSNASVLPRPLQHVRRLHAPQFRALAAVSGAAALWTAWDAGRRVLVFFDVKEDGRSLRVRQRCVLPDAGSAPGVRSSDAKLSAEIIFVDAQGAVHSEHVVLAEPSVVADDHEERTRTALEAAAAFFRRDRPEKEQAKEPEPAAPAAASGESAPGPATHSHRRSEASGTSTPQGPAGSFSGSTAAFFKRDAPPPTLPVLTPPPAQQWRGTLIGDRPLSGAVIDEQGTLWLWGSAGVATAALSADGISLLYTFPCRSPRLLQSGSPSAVFAYDSPAGAHLFSASGAEAAPAGLQVATAAENGSLLVVREAQGRLCVALNGRELLQTAASTSEEAKVLLPLNLERVVTVDAAGEVRASTFNDLVGGAAPQRSHGLQLSTRRINILRAVNNVRTGVRYIVGASVEGDLVIWDAASLRQVAQWAVFVTPTVHIVSLLTGDLSRLRGCVAAVAADGTVAILLLDGFVLLCLVPGRGVPLWRLALRADDLLLVYADGRARVWDVSSYELRRSIDADQANALLEEKSSPWWSVALGGPEAQTDVDTRASESSTVAVLSPSSILDEAGQSAVAADLRRAIEAASRAVGSLDGPRPTLGGSEAPADLALGPDAFASIGRNGAPEARAGVKEASNGAKKAISVLRPFLAALLPRCVAPSTDLLRHLGAPGESSSRLAVGVIWRTGHTCEDASASAAADLCVTPALTAYRLLASTAMLLVLANVRELEASATRLVASLAVGLAAAVGPSFAHPSLTVLAAHYMDDCAELKQAARALFDPALEAASGTAVQELCDSWAGKLPSRQGAVYDADSSQALMLLGLIAAARYKMLPPHLLKDVATSIEASLADEWHPAHQAVAIELCCRAFVIWQHYFDAMEVVRTLFSLATNKESAASQEIRILARQATMQIAADNTPLFMTTLSLDILHARSPAHCSATMRLVAFMVRKKPLVLYPNLPRLAEAVVKSLDPTMTAMREAVVQAATVMIAELVATYPMIAFHARMQRLAVGTEEGAVIMYDLKTATRLYVVEGHAGVLSACDFSPDGRRLVTVSLGEGKALIWKIGSGLGSLFSPGSLPRQGGTDASGAYKAISFGVGAEAADASAADVLHAVAFEWQGERSVRLRVGDASMVFSVA